MYPIVLIASYEQDTYYDGTPVAVCYTAADTFWPALYFVATILLFFALPFVVLLLLYSAIAYKLLRRKSAFRRPISPPAVAIAAALTALPTRSTTVAAPPPRPGLSRHQAGNGMQQHRKQVIGMLVAVVSSFFLCHLPFRALTLWIVLASTPDDMAALGVEGYYSLLYFCRLMFYLNSALNPILYNLMSTKFRTGFWLLIVACCQPERHSAQQRDRRLAYSSTPDRRRFSAGAPPLQHAAARPQLTEQKQPPAPPAEPPDRKRWRRRRREFCLRRDGTFIINSMSTSSGSGATERTSCRSASSSTGERRASSGAVVIVGGQSCRIARTADERQTMAAALNTAACIYGRPLKDEAAATKAGGSTL